ncbi:hypothetical protein BD289DRAFT_494214 [Coniella lustricola]|uniref:Polyketide synthase n=1 Tax=Coniella lustricola TaxID=2025994 RepID=A0A2T2ZV44_9PEZI|nr:hypothetical protein BD289DRAFT_494214 [Coniella lustricola]
MFDQVPEPIAIVGSACRFPGGASSPAALWKLLQTPRDIAIDIPPDRFALESCYRPDGTHHGTTNVRQSYLLQEDLRLFDASFFNISSNEADSMDPQHRLLLETVYEALEFGGHRIEALRGSDTAVYTGTMCVDYNDVVLRDLDTIPTYFATGANRAVISNRVSYFFDWHGPSMTIDTACSSSLVAVHQGIKSLRNGESKVVLACGTQIILNPETYVMESKLGMLSPTSRSRMWDADADGYARGEGVAAVVLKRLSDAIADGNHIESIIRETGSNQDGHSNGITVPSTEAQASLIRQTYRRAGLDPERDPNDRPQYFEAHGTGTKAGDPREAAAIHQIFGQSDGTNCSPLYVGSVKTIIGHLEGAAGLAGLLKASAMVQAGFITPNLLFHRLNPDIEPYYNGLEVPTQLLAWPKIPDGAPRRASVNSFGFGGSNAHAIVEQYREVSSDVNSRNGKTVDDSMVQATPFVFSAASEASLVAQLRAYSDYLIDHQDISPFDLAWTLTARRSEFSHKAAFSASNIAELKLKIDARLAELDSSSGSIVATVTKSSGSRPRVLGVFTGQGAQWPTMGAQLIRNSDYVHKRVQYLEQSLATLPPSDRPTWKLCEEMLAEGTTSRIHEAALSQPLCTALQIILVDLLQEAGIGFAAVVGHSSGEIAAAYAAGFISAYDAIRIAYYRGLVIAKAPQGAMLAVGTSWEDANDLVRLRAFQGRLAVAAHNSSASVTISGNSDAVVHAKKVFDEEKKFARLLKVEKAYHSHHMIACSEDYIRALQACAIDTTPNKRGTSSCAWFSSVSPSAEPIRGTEGLQDMYWRDNLTSPVLFSDSVSHALASDERIGLVLEVGPHPALKGPMINNISDVRSASLPYYGTLSRGADDVVAFSDALGALWTQLGSRGVDLQSYGKTFKSESSALISPRVVTGLPSYQWNHGRSHWSESRRSRRIRSRNTVAHELLGSLLPESNAYDMRWTNLLRPSEISWLDGHKLQGQRVFPAAGYVAMALEASRAIDLKGKPVDLYEVHNLTISKAITFEDADNSAVETLVTLTQVQHQESLVTAHFSCYALPVLVVGTDRELELAATGTITVVLGSLGEGMLALTPPEDYNMSALDPQRFYSFLTDLGYNYSGSFSNLHSMRRKLNYATGLIDSYSGTNVDVSSYLIHPSTLDMSFQLAILAHSAPGDGQLWAIHVPTSIQSIRISPGLCALAPRGGTAVPACATVDAAAGSFSACIDILSEDSQEVMVRIDELVIKPFASATQTDDRVMFTHTKFDLAGPDGSCIVEGARPSDNEVAAASACERISYYYHRKWKSEITDAEWASGPPHHTWIKNWIDDTVSRASSGKHPSLKQEWTDDSPESIKALARKYWHCIDIRLVTAVGENMVAAVRGETTILEHMTTDNMLDEYYEKGPGLSTYHHLLATMATQITHRYPHAKFIEIGAGTGGATKPVVEAIGSTMSSYTYTDISRGFFARAANSFAAYSNKMVFRTLDIEKDPASQGYEPQSYDVAIAFNVLHATRSLQTTLANTRRLLKPGGYLMLLEFTNNNPIRFGTTMAGLPGWWLGVDDGRIMAPTVSTHVWHNTLRKAGFGGVDTATPEIDGVTWPISILVAQAIDDRVNFLRRPLSSRPSLTLTSGSFVKIESLVILGNTTLVTSRIAEGLVEYLERFCDEITVLDCLPTEQEAAALSPLSTFINLVDLDSPIFKDVTSEKMSGLQRMFDMAKHVLWITQGAIVEQPYHMASLSFSRTVRREAQHVSLNHLDIADAGEAEVPKHIAEHLLRLFALDEWEAGTGKESNGQPLLWSKEPETFLARDKLKLPRLVADEVKNARLNAMRRPITKTLRATDSSANAELAWSQDNSVPQLVDLDISTGGTCSKPHNSLFRNDCSSLMALNVALDTYLFVAAGKHDTTGDRVVSLLEVNSLRSIPIVSVTIPVETSNNSNFSLENLVVATTAELIASAVLQNMTNGARVLVHRSREDCTLISALYRRAASLGIHLIMMGHQNKDLQDTRISQDQVSFINLSTRMSQHDIRRAIQRARPTHFVDLTTRGGQEHHQHQQHLDRRDLGFQICRELSASCKIVANSDLFRHQSQLSNSNSVDELALSHHLEHVVSRALSTLTSGLPSPPSSSVIPVHQIQDSVFSYYPTSAVRWFLEQPFDISVRPVSARGMFSRDKTYLLAGLSGQIGQSLCKFMVAQGAGVVCLTSRHPVIDERWIASLRQAGGEVKVLPMDVTDRSNVEEVVASIRASCPQIAGVAHGAMVLSDALFSKMTLEDMKRVLGPKIDGANHLDDIFSGEDLDFFVLFSSVSCAMGNVGQSNYAAANGYLNGLARQRRKRGLPASIFDIGRVAGLGYIETVSQELLDQLLALGLQSISESDLRQAFIETIKMGHVRPNDHEIVPDAVVTTGIRSFRDDENVKGPWFTNPFFSHLVIESASMGSTSQSEEQKTSPKTTLRVSQQIAQATCIEEAGDILKECLCEKLRVVLQVFDQDIDRDIPLVELGIDSLVAVEVRSWFLKELKVDVSVLRIIGGDSLSELCDSALDKLPKELQENIRNQVPKSEPPQPEAATSLSLTAATVASLSDSPESMVSLKTKPTTLPSASSTPESQTGAPLTTTNTTAALIKSQVMQPSPKGFVKNVPISLAQSRYWFLHHLLRDQKTSNVAFYYHVEGKIRTENLARALRLVVARHESLRTCFVQDESDAAQAYQRILARSSIHLKCERADTLEQVAERFAALRKHEFDLASGELLQMVLLTLSPSSHYLLVHHHHILMDGVSMQIFLADLEKAYSSQPLGRAPYQYPDFSIAQRQDFEKGNMVDELSYWRGVFPVGKEVPVLPLLPMARTSSRVVMHQFDTHEVHCRLDSAVAAKVRLAAKRQRSTPFHVYLAAFQGLLYRFTKTEEVVIGMADAARNSSELLDCVGFFLNLLPLRFACQPDQSFSEAIVNARNISHAALKSSRLPFDILLMELDVPRSASHSPLFQSFIDYRQGSPQQQAWADCQMEMKEWHLGKTAYDITVDVTDAATDAVIMLRVQKSLYDLTAAQLLIDTYVHLLHQFTQDPSLSLSAATLFSKRMLSHAVEVGRGPDMSSDWPETLPHRIDQVAQEYPNRIALLDGKGTKFSYSSMLARIEVIAEVLRSAGIGPGAHALVFQTASADWACSMLAIMRVGAVYIPLDLRSPMPRLAAVAAQCAAAAILTDAELVSSASQLNAPQAHVVDVSTIPLCPTSDTRSESMASSNAPAAILFTSGSTGVPKGILISHSGLRNELEGYTKTWKLSAERVLQQSAFTFDFATDQMFTGLVNGGSVYFAPSSMRGSPVDITDLIVKHNITYTRATPSEYLLWMQYGADNLRLAVDWRFAFAGGEALTSTLIHELANLGLKHLRFFNSYGPAETSVSSCKMEVDYRTLALADDKVGRIPCGYSLPNYHTYIVDERLQPVPVGMPGEVCIGGAGVSLGYLGNKPLTDHHFIHNPYASAKYRTQGWTRMYRTGSIGHQTQNGNLVFHGRIEGDTQVKIRGIRIDLADVESNLIATAQGVLAEAVVTLREHDETQFLVAHVVFAPRSAITDQQSFLEQLLSQLPLPQYMVPVVAIPINQLPLNSHSKVVRKAVRAMPLSRNTKSRKVPDVSTDMGETLWRLKNLWQDVIGARVAGLGMDLGPSTNFFRVGGNSLLAIRLQSRIRQTFSVSIPLVKFMGAETLAEMAAIIDEAASITVIDWNEETALPEIPNSLIEINTTTTTDNSRRQGKTVIVTGSTGFLGRHLLPILAADPHIATIHCIAVRDEASGQPRTCPFSSNKIVYHRGNLTMALLGLREDIFHDLASQGDLILHLGASRSVWDKYHVLRATNLQSTKELIKMAAPRHIPIHFISTIAAAANTTSSLATSSTPPSPDGANGYVASKWASERALTNAADSIGVPCTIYRFLPVEHHEAAPKQLIDELVGFVESTGLEPDPSGWDGLLYLAPLEQVTQMLYEAAISGSTKDKGATFKHYQCEVSLTGEELVTRICGNSNMKEVHKIPMLKWFGRIKKGRFNYFIASHKATIGGRMGLGSSR